MTMSVVWVYAIITLLCCYYYFDVVYVEDVLDYCNICNAYIKTFACSVKSRVSFFVICGSNDSQSKANEAFTHCFHTVSLSK